MVPKVARGTATTCSCTLPQAQLETRLPKSPLPAPAKRCRLPCWLHGERAQGCPPTFMRSTCDLTSSMLCAARSCACRAGRGGAGRDNRKESRLPSSSGKRSGISRLAADAGAAPAGERNKNAALQQSEPGTGPEQKGERCAAAGRAGRQGRVPGLTATTVWHTPSMLYGKSPCSRSSSSSSYAAAGWWWGWVGLWWWWGGVRQAWSVHGMRRRSGRPCMPPTVGQRRRGACAWAGSAKQLAGVAQGGAGRAGAGGWPGPPSGSPCSACALMMGT